MFSHKDQKEMFSDLKKGLLTYILCFLNKKEKLSLKKEIKNKRLFKVLIENIDIPRDNFDENPCKLILREKVAEFSARTLPNNFIIFNSTDEELYLVYPNKLFQIEIKDLLNHSKERKILRGHRDVISCLRTYEFYLISGSYDKSVKIWNLKNYCCEINIEDIYFSKFLISCFMCELKGNIYIFTAVKTGEHMKMYDMKGNKLKEFGCSKQDTFFINMWTRSINESYLINCNNQSVKFYDMNLYDLNKSFEGRIKVNSSYAYINAYVYQNNSDYLLVAINTLGFLNIWNIDNNIIIREVNIKGYLIGLIHWSNEFALVSELFSGIRIVDTTKGCIYKTIPCIKPTTIIKLYHKNLGECMLSGGNDGIIYLFQISSYKHCN